MRLLLTGGSGFIGTNLIHFYRESADAILNLDIAEPLNPEDRAFWKRVDIMDASMLSASVAAFAPTHVIHLAARTDCVEDVDVHVEYDVNITGTQHVLEAIKACSCIERVIITSSQYVCGPEHFPENDTDYGPHTVYGQSKVITEQLTREAGLNCIWTLIRPENIWGPWHMRYRSEAWRIIRKGLYLHPGGKPVIRCYGYVGNIIWQMDEIFKAPKAQVHKAVFYVGDRAEDIYDWVNEFSLQLTGKRARKVPRFFLQLIGWVGDVITAVTGRKFALTSSRYESMTQDYLTPIEKTFDVFGEPPFSLKAGVEKTVRWLHEYDG
ncbi:NAD(P)-dependent oxidoreductase [Verrucomicrobia bacterium S94]|nr:NAD(P)-dependent oxidoreductase [Verrucomicrobia bacterium S94]